MTTILRTCLRIPVLVTFFVCLQASRAQVTSIFLSGHAEWLEESRQLTFDVAVPSHAEVLTVEYRVIGGTAEEGRDFLGASGILTFDPDQQFKARAITIQLLDDREFEGNEQFYIELFNAVPANPISTPRTVITIIDDESGYDPEYLVYTQENADFVEVPIYRHGDIDFASSVDVYFEAETARPGIDYMNETFTVNFGPNESVKKIRARLINNPIEDGERWFRVGVRNPTGGIPISSHPSGEIIIEDNELGYGFRIPSGASELELYEGGSEPLILERRGDYDVHSTAVVKVNLTPRTFPYPWQSPPAEAGIDFVGSEFEVEFAPGQKSAEVPLVIVNDAIPESSEWIQLQYTTNLTSGALGEQLLYIRDNEFNPLPATPFCLGVGLAQYPLTPLRDGKFLAVTGDEANNTYNYRIIRFTEAGEPDPDFTPMALNGRPTKIVEGSDGKFTIGLWRDIEQGLQRFDSTGAPDPFFQQLTQRYVADFEVTADGKVYVTDPLRRLNTNGSVDLTFAPPETYAQAQVRRRQRTIPVAFAPPETYAQAQDVILDSDENVYCRDSFGDWHRLSPEGVVDPNFYVNFTDFLFTVGDALYISHGEFNILRVTETGEVDPTFTPISSSLIEAGPDGKLYAFRSNFAEMSVERYNADGTLDTSYLRGTIDSPLDETGLFMLKNGRGMLAVSYLGKNSINGTLLGCDNGSAAIARIDLDIPPQRFLVEPNKTNLPERDTGEAKVLPFIRTGDNQSATAIHYRIRPGTALPGEHYSILSEGEIRMDAGVSRVLVPVAIFDNQKPELDRSFFVDFLNEGGSVLSSSKVTIRNDDLGIQILSHKGNTWRILPISGEYPNLLLMRSSDLVKWEYFGSLPGGVPADLENPGNRAFFRGYGYIPW